MDHEPAIHKGRQNSLVVSSCIMTGLGVISVILRLLSRHIVVRKLGADDILMLTGMILTCFYLFEILYGIRFGIGLHGADLTTSQMVGLMKIIFVVQLTYNTVIAVVKLSIVSFYLRLGSTSRLYTTSWITIIFLIVFYFTTQVASVLQCLPVEGNWDISGKLKKRCFNTLAYFYVVATVNILVDVWILVMPISTLRRIKRPRRDKIVLFIVFGIGAFSCISSMVRLYTIKMFAQSKDPFFDGAPINMWSLIEVNLAIICSSVPAMKPLLLRTMRNHSNPSDGTPTFGTHQMMPLGDNDRGRTPSPKAKTIDSMYSANATLKYDLGASDEYMISKQGGPDKRTFTIEEQYDHEQPLSKTYQ